MLNLDTIPAKFHPFLLGHEKCPEKDLKTKIDSFDNLLNNMNSPTYDAGEWIIGSTDPKDTSNSELYRVRKAKKFEEFLKNNNYGNEFEVAKSYLYWNESKKKFYTVTQKLNVSDEVAKPFSDKVGDKFKKAPDGKELTMQMLKLSQGNPQRELTVNQANGLAYLTTLGYEKLSYNDLYFTKEGKVAISDTYPSSRQGKKYYSKINFFSLFIDIDFFLSAHVINSLGMLKAYCNKEAFKEVQQSADNCTSRISKKLAYKAGRVAIAVIFTLVALNYLPLAPVAISALKISVLGYGIIRGAALGLEFGIIKRLNFLGSKESLERPRKI